MSSNSSTPKTGNLDISSKIPYFSELKLENFSFDQQSLPVISSKGKSATASFVFTSYNSSSGILSYKMWIGDGSYVYWGEMSFPIKIRVVSLR